MLYASCAEAYLMLAPPSLRRNRSLVFSAGSVAFSLHELGDRCARRHRINRIRDRKRCMVASCAQSSPGLYGLKIYFTKPLACGIYIALYPAIVRFA
jgi:hypothetical protein